MKTYWFKGGSGFLCFMLIWGVAIVTDCSRIAPSALNSFDWPTRWCNLCENNESFYIGQTVNSCRSRANGHRGRFNRAHYKNSALSYHMYKDHPSHIDEKLSIYSYGIIKSVVMLIIMLSILMQNYH